MIVIQKKSQLTLNYSVLLKKNVKFVKAGLKYLQ